MLHPGEQIQGKTDTWVVQEFIAAGGQAQAYRAKGRSGREGVLKVLHAEFRGRGTRRRLQYLQGLDLATMCPTLCGPVDVIDRGPVLGHVSRYAPGRPLEELLIDGGIDLVSALQTGATLAHSLAALHAHGIAHGDVQPDNVMVARHDGGACVVHVIDLDNFAAPGLPAPPSIGHHLYMAPEIRIGRSGPSIAGDCFGLAVMLHDLILLRHPAAGFDGSKEDFERAMTCGWRHDPALSRSPGASSGGYPAEILDADLARMFRAGLSPDPPNRPSAANWRDALVKAMFNVFACPHCAGPNLVDSSKTHCPMCGQPYPVLALQGSFGRVVLERASVVVGRQQLGGSEHVSERHAVIRRIGPEYRIEDCSTNGTFRRQRSDWLRLPRGDELERQPLIDEGDRLRFADVEAQLVRAA